jgi:hypothetical protein
VSGSMHFRWRCPECRAEGTVQLPVASSMTTSAITLLVGASHSAKQPRCDATPHLVPFAEPKTETKPKQEADR